MYEGFLTAAIMNTVFREEVTAFAAELSALKIPYAFVDNKIDDLKDNLECLEDGIIHCLVTRHIPQQAQNALKTFADCISRHKFPTQRNRYVHMDILTRMNIDEY